jgi:hypothetical protein
MKTLRKKIIESIFFGLFVLLAAFVLYKAGLASHNRCKAANSTIEDYRFCMNI